MARSVIALICILMALTGAHAQGGYARGTTAVERAQLPTYCYAQYVDEKLAGQPGYSIPRSCGAWMNHLCPGLIHLIRAKKATEPARTRRTNAQQAIEQFNYTLSHMESGCPLRADVETAMARARAITATAK
jgi:hypothetical protein